MRYVMALAIVFLLPYAAATLHVGDGREAYALQGAARQCISIQTSDGVREIDFEDYVCAVAARELNGSCPLEAAKAQMVLVRTNLRKFQEDHPGTLLSEEYMTLEQIEEKGMLQDMLQAMEETKGQVLTFQGEKIQAPFHLVSSGRTRSGEDAGIAGEYSWLTAKESRQDLESEWYLSIRAATPEEIRRQIVSAYPQALTEEALAGQLEVLARDTSGYVTRMRIGKEEISGEKFRSILGLASSCFYLEEIGGWIRITTKGVGHGLGLSCYGAAQMAREGKDYREILQHYFANCQLVREE